jgi:hypothetical protein
MKLRRFFLLLVLLVAAALAGAGCVTETEMPTGLTAGQRADLARLVRSVRSSRGAELRDNLFMIVAYGPFAVDVVDEELLSDERPRVRSNAVFVLGQIHRQDGDMKALELVAEALDDSDPLVRTEAAAALLEVGDLRGADLLVDALEDPNAARRTQVFVVLERATGLSFGYDPNADANARREAVTRFREYFRVTRSGG